MLPEGLLEIIVIGGHSTDNSLEAAAVVSAEVASTSRDQREKEEPQANAESCDDLGFLRADDRVRTGDLNLGKVALYQLSYVRSGCTS